MKNIGKPLVSVVIPSKNEEKNISNCLKSIKLQGYPAEKIEIIVVVNEDSSDRTKEIAKTFTDKVYIKGTERSEPRNFGLLRKSSGEYLVYLDADMILSSTVIERSVEKLEKNELVALYIPEIVLGNSYWSRVRRFERSFYDGTVVDCVRIIRKDVFKKIEGFDLSLIGPEDWDLDKKVRSYGRVQVLDKYDFDAVDSKLAKFDYLSKDFIERLSRLSPLGLVYHNESKFNLRKYVQKKNYYARSFKAYIEKWGKKDSDIKKQFGFSYRYFNVFLENQKWKRAIRHPDLMTGVFLLRFLVGAGFISSKINAV